MTDNRAQDDVRPGPTSGCEISVIVPAHNPHAGRLQQTLAALGRQSLAAEQWELLVVDNASAEPDSLAQQVRSVAPHARVVREDRLGLTHARLNGFRHARGALAVLVDDDNVLAPDYLAHVRTLFMAHPEIGVLGGKVRASFELAPPPWATEFLPLLAISDHGEQWLQTNGFSRREYPAFAPAGAGMALRREVWQHWRDEIGRRTTSLSDRRGRELTSAGDNDIVLCALEAGWQVAYSPELSLDHLIPARRVEPEYLARLNRGIQKSWMQVLSLHGANTWPRLTRTGAALRVGKAWLLHRPWSSAPARIRWHGARGHFEGRIATKDRA